MGGHLGGLRNLGGDLQIFSGPLPANNKHMFGFLSLSLFDWHPCWVI